MNCAPRILQIEPEIPGYVQLRPAAARDSSHVLKNIKEFLIPGGAEGVQRLTGFIISSTPADHPNTIVLGILDRNTPDVQLRFVDRRGNRAYANRPFPVGGEVRFQGVGIDFVAVPFLVMLEADLNWVAVSEPRSRASELDSQTPKNREPMVGV